MLRSCATASQIVSPKPWHNRAFSATCSSLQEEVKRRRGRPRKDESLARLVANVDRVPNGSKAELPANKDEAAWTTGTPSTGHGNPAAKSVPLESAGTASPPPTTGKRHPAPTASLPPRIIPANSKHHDLPSFLHHAASTSLDPSSNVYKGTLYEYRVAQCLQPYNFSLTHFGRPDDRGIDLLGHWHLPGHTTRRPRELPVIVQCKALKPRPSMIRELEGAYAGAPAGWRSESAMALLVASGESTKGVGEALQRSRCPMGVMCVTEDEGVLRQFLWNDAAARLGLEGLGVAVRYGGKGTEDGCAGESIALTWMGEVWRGKGARKSSTRPLSGR